MQDMSEPDDELIHETRQIDLAQMSRDMNKIGNHPRFTGSTDSLREDLLRRAATITKQVDDLDSEIESLNDHRQNHVLSLEIINATIALIDERVK